MDRPWAAASTGGEMRRAPFYCPACLHVTSRKDLNCHHCGHRHGVGTRERLYLIGLMVAVMIAAAISVRAVTAWLAPTLLSTPEREVDSPDP